MNSLSSLNRRLFDQPRDFAYNHLFLTAQAFARIEASSGIVLVLAALVALIWANSPWSDSYFDLLHTHISIDASIVHLDLSLQHWINDGLMAIFFFVMGLEIKRELIRGELSSPRKALLPALAALGGMIAPALIFTVFNAGGEGSRGWGIPIATDIAFALGILSLLSRRVPFSARVFLLALAIVDDIGGILVIAMFYTAEISFSALGIAAFILGIIYVCNRWGVRTINIYLVLGAMMWIAVHESGIHATLTGVVLGLLTPASYYYNPATFAESAEDLADRYRAALAAGSTTVQAAILTQMEDLAKGTEAPLERLEHALVRWVGFSIVPIFALANAGVAISGDTASDALSSPISLGIALGLVVGKPLGIFTFTFLAVKLGLCDMPRGANWGHVFGVGLLGGIGFTVSLLITDLAFRGTVGLSDEAKLGILAASVVAAIGGLTFLFLMGRVSEVTEQEPSRATEPV